MQVVDDFLPNSLFKWIRDCCITPGLSKIPYSISVTNTYDTSLNFVFTIAGPHPLADMFMPLVIGISDYVGVTPAQLTRIRVGLTPQANEPEIKQRHTDQSYPHIGALYYLNDSDGDTVFWRDSESDEVIARVTPKANRLVVFNGDTYHSSSSPVDTKLRAVINFNFKLPEG